VRRAGDLWLALTRLRPRAEFAKLGSTEGAQSYA
jgi:hypothetical protein